MVFLDPYGMQVEWSTIEALAATKAIDLWYLFPLGVGVARLLTHRWRYPRSVETTAGFALRHDGVAHGILPGDTGQPNLFGESHDVYRT